MTDYAAWQAANHRRLLAALDRVRRALQHHAGEAPEPEPADAPLGQIEPPPALEQVARLFDLSPFERDVLVLCAGVELDARFAPLCAAAQGDPQRTYPTFGLALAALPEPTWAALTPAAPLRRWRLIEVGAGQALTTSPLRIDERVLHFLVGIEHPDERLAGIVAPLPPTHEPVPSHRAIVERLARACARAAASGGRPPLIQLCGEDAAGKRSIAAELGARLGLRVDLTSGQVIPTAPAELDNLLRTWEREATLAGAALVVDCDDVDPGDLARDAAVARFLERVGGLAIATSRERRRPLQRPVLTIDVGKPTAEEQRALWRAALGPAAAPLNGQVDNLVMSFNLGAPAIEGACAEALGEVEEPTPERLGQALWDSCRAQARPRLDDLAQRIESSAGWDDLVLPAAQKEILRDIAEHVRQRSRVYGHWGFAGKGARGLGISALFSGASGTGKTMAAEVLAAELKLDLYRIDLSAMVSKYIGETEKNLRRVFDAAEEGGAVLLFDEADALFGKRSEVKDSHDRYANIEVSYLLQRMEAYRGLAILTTNLPDSLDQAFVRRIRFIVQFPFPDHAQRAEIWRRAFPKQAPLDGVDVQKLAQLHVAGGNIRSIALAAAFIAAGADEPVRMSHLLRAARNEYRKLERPLTDAEIKEWTT